MLNLEYIKCILDIADTRSFSRTSERLGVAQSVISTRVRRVEEQLGLRLFARTSRSVQLTRQGRAFLPFAQSMIDAEIAARHAAKNLHVEMANHLVLGTYDFLIDHRQDVMDRFHARYPEAKTEVVFGSRSELFSGIRTGRLDVVMIKSLPSHIEPDFRIVKLPQHCALLAVPPGHFLFDCECIGSRDLAGLEIVYSPSMQDPLVRSVIAGQLARQGVRFVLAPEAHRPAMEHFADIRGLPLLRWKRPQKQRTLLDGRAEIPFEGIELRIDSVIYAAKTDRRPVADRFMEVAAAAQAELR
jgi:DNA-binding transcriptional LysR family regulator